MEGRSNYTDKEIPKERKNAIHKETHREPIEKYIHRQRQY